MIYKKIKNLSFFTKSLALSVISLLPLLLLIFSIIFPQIKKTFFEERYNSTRQTVEQLIRSIDAYNKEFEKNKISLEEAKNLAINLINNQKIDSDNYFWVNDLDYNLIVHPLRPNKIGKKVKDLVDAEGKKVYEEFVKICLNQEEGFVKYNQLKPGYKNPQLKVSYVKLYKPWNWVIGRGVYLAKVENSFSLINSYLVITSIFAIILAVLMGVLLAKYLTGPIKILNSAVQKISEGDFNISVNYESNDEIGMLAKTFNTMIQSVNSLIEEIKIKSKEVELTAIEMQKANNLKFEFLNLISNEIRDPLNLLVSTSEITSCKQNILTEENCCDQLIDIKKISERIQRTFELIINMSVIQSGNFETTKQNINLYNDILLPIIENYKFRANKKNIELNIQKLSVRDEVYVDKSTVKQSLCHILDNAIKFTDNGHINIILDNNENKLAVRIVDTGIGISDNFIPEIFTPFSQENQNSVISEGSGLGLSITKKYCELNDIEIYVQSIKNEGTKFHLVFENSNLNKK